MDMPFFTPPPHTEICHFNIVTFSKYPVTSHGSISIPFLETHISYNNNNIFELQHKVCSVAIITSSKNINGTQSYLYKPEVSLVEIQYI